MSDNGNRSQSRKRSSAKGNTDKGGKKRSRSRSRGRSKKVDPVKYWGDPALLSDDDEYIVTTPDPSTVINSLGRPPIPGHENASKHYFSLVYDRASALAVALAAAGGLGDYAPPDAGEDDQEESPSTA